MQREMSGVLVRQEGIENKEGARDADERGA